MSNAEQSTKSEESSGLLQAIIAFALLIFLTWLASYAPGGTRECLANRDAKIAQGIQVGTEEQECPPPSLGYPGF